MAAKLLELLHQIAPNVVQPAQPKGLDHQPAITVRQHVVQHAGLGAGNQLQQKHPTVHGRT